MDGYQTLERSLRDRAAATYEERYSREKGCWFDYAERALFAAALSRGKRPKVALDLGSGTGRITQAAASLVNHVAAVDFSHASLLRVSAKRLPNVTTCCADIVSGLPYRDEAADAILSCQVLQHLLLPDFMNALAECHRILRRDGQLLISVYNAEYFRWRGVPEEIDSSGLYFKRFTARELRKLALKAGFKVRRLRYFKALPHIIGARFGGNTAGMIDALISKVPVVNRRIAGYLFCEFEKGHRQKGDRDSSAGSRLLLADGR